MLSMCQLAAQKKETGTIEGDAWVMGNVPRGGGKDGDAARNISRWRLGKAPRMRDIGNSGHLSWGPSALALPSLANAMHNHDRAVLTTIPLWYFQSKSHVLIIPGQ